MAVLCSACLGCSAWVGQGTPRGAQSAGILLQSPNPFVLIPQGSASLTYIQNWSNPWGCAMLLLAIFSYKLDLLMGTCVPVNWLLLTQQSVLHQWCGWYQSQGTFKALTQERTHQISKAWFWHRDCPWLTQALLSFPCNAWKSSVDSAHVGSSSSSCTQVCRWNRAGEQPCSGAGTNNILFLWSSA